MDDRDPTPQEAWAEACLKAIEDIKSGNIFEWGQSYKDVYEILRDVDADS